MDEYELKVRPMIRQGGTVVMCEGIYDLLCRVDSMGSLNAAAKDMRMSYSKAWRLMNDAAAAGTPLLGWNGDSAHAGSRVTHAARALMREYERAVRMGNGERL